jgi:hypothetical protein
MHRDTSSGLIGGPLAVMEPQLQRSGVCESREDIKSAGESSLSAAIPTLEST